MRIPSPTSLFDKLPICNVRINQSSSCGKWEEVLTRYHEMHRTGVQLTDPSAFPRILKACANLPSIHGKTVHAYLIKLGFQSFVSVGSSIMDFYAKAGDLDSALGVFDCMRSKDSVSWNIIIRGHLDQGLLEEGLWWFSKARSAGFEPNISTLVLVVQACRSLAARFEGLKVHGYMIQSGFLTNSSIQNSLLSMYAAADMESAQLLFDEMHDKDVISWSMMIGAYVQNEVAQFGLNLFREMVSEVGIKPDGVTIVSVLKACTVLRGIHMGRAVHGLVLHRGFGNDLFVGNSLVDMYSKCNDADAAFLVFSEMLRRNNVSWNSILSGFVLNEKYSETASLFYSMGKERTRVDEVALVSILKVCKYFQLPLQSRSIHCVIIRQGYGSNELAVNSLIDTYAKCNLVELAWKLFDVMKRRDVVAWSTMIAGFTHCGKPDEAIAVFREMSLAQEKPNAVTIINLLEACSVSAELTRSKWAHGIAIRRGLAVDVAVGTAIIDMYSKCGDIEAAKRAFDVIPQKNIMSWSAMISAYGMNGLATKALALVTEMKQHGLNPNAVTTLSVLSACSHGGLVEEGLSFFKLMAQDHGVEPGLEHYSCIVDMLGRAGQLDIAMELIEKVPSGLKAGASAWGALLSACRSYQDAKFGARVACHLLELEPSDPAAYLLASNMYAAGNLWDNASTMRKLVKERAGKVVAGCSLVHVDKKACRFVAGDKSNPQALELNCIIEQLHGCLKINEEDNNSLFEC